MKIHCAKKMNAAIEAVQAFAAEHPALCIDINKECTDGWGPNYAICQFMLDNAGAEYFNWDRAIEDLHDVIKKVFGKKFKVEHYPNLTPPKKYKVGMLYLFFHGGSHGEIEAYRCTKKS